MRLASININKRLGNPAVRTRLSAWLKRHGVDVLLAQEPWKPVGRAPIELAGFRAVGGDGNLHAWTAEQWTSPSVRRPEDFVQCLELGWLLVLNVYLDAYSPAERARQLNRINELLAKESGRPCLVCGDFNVAPRPYDGVTDGRPSSFNNAVDRTPLQRLLTDHHLVDLTVSLEPDHTVERVVRGRSVQFRCDLALAHDHLTATAVVDVDHSPRVGDSAFTDHSGLVVSLPLSLGQAVAEEQDTLFSLLPEPMSEATAREYQPHKTAMSRRAESSYARFVGQVLAPRLGLKTVLDHGCGRGSDVEYYRSVGLLADGWDPHPGFGATTEPEGQYDMVTSVFVLNVLPDPWQRIRALRHAAGFLKPRGYLLVVVRSPADIEPRAASAAWPSHHDGYWSSTAKGTFQKGIVAEEIIALAWHAGLVPVEEAHLRSPSAGAEQALLSKQR